MNSQIVIEVQGLSKRYGKLLALNNVNFSIHGGEIFGLLGPNGAGKSTFISILTTLSKPTAGDILIKGFSATKQPDKIKRSIGFVPQDIALYSVLSGMDNLNFWAGIYGLKGELKKQRIEEALSIVRLADRAKDKVENYSGGMKRRLNIAVALLHHPEILVMDEPTVGVDIQSRKYIIDGIMELKKEGRTVIFTSHYIDEMESLCDRIAIIDKGTIRNIGTVNELKHAYGKENIEEIMLDFMEE
ncbi:MAG: ABC transporter ATP-binding protein [Clostridia bacterium]|nr:ABC transporter ATP-binding protein [Clostridia bacterium]